jgi:hypothetical protein
LYSNTLNVFSIELVFLLDHVNVDIDVVVEVVFVDDVFLVDVDVDVDSLGDVFVEDVFWCRC